MREVQQSASLKESFHIQLIRKDSQRTAAAHVPTNEPCETLQQTCSPRDRKWQLHKWLLIWAFNFSIFVWKPPQKPYRKIRNQKSKCGLLMITLETIYQLLFAVIYVFCLQNIFLGFLLSLLLFLKLNFVNWPLHISPLRVKSTFCNYYLTSANVRRQNPEENPEEKPICCILMFWCVSTYLFPAQYCRIAWNCHNL